MDSARISGADEWENFVSQSFYAMSVDSAPSKFIAAVRSAALSPAIRLSELRENAPTALRRSASLVRSNPSDELLFLTQGRGESQIEQAGQRTTLRSGEATFCDPSVPYSIESNGDQSVTMVDRAAVLPPRIRASDVRLRPLSLTLSPLRVFRLLAEEMVSHPADDGAADSLSVAHAAIELLRSAAVAAATSDVQVRSWSRETQLRAAKEYLLAHLATPGLRMEQVAADNQMSVRQLSAIFAPDDSPAAFLRRERLRRAHLDLVDPRLAAVPVAAIGVRWGFGDASSFARAYRRAFGHSPQEGRSIGGAGDLPDPRTR
ncbi:MAG: helix-turn-helix domain-containing protein [Nocardioides sp.]|uniref:helix-turn-helix domain-containing protein n=1 Tax=Nocardioides sp. TaxID=35761 RepID=UPI0039E4877B